MTAIRDTAAMIAGMSPVLRPGAWVFVTSDDPALRAEAIATMREPEGLSLIVPAGLVPAGSRWRRSRSRLPRRSTGLA